MSLWILIQLEIEIHCHLFDIIISMKIFLFYILQRLLGNIWERSDYLKF